MKKFILLFLIYGAVSFVHSQTTWETTAQIRRGISGARAVVIDSTVYVIGGYSDSTQRAVEWIQKFDPATGSFTLVTKMRRRRAFHIAVEYNRKIYIAGGEYNQPHTPSGLLEVFDPATGEVSPIDSNKKFSRYSMAAVVMDSILYMIGGDPYEQQHGGPAAYIMEYSLPQLTFTYGYTQQFSGNNLRDGQMAVPLDSNIYIFGGLYNTILTDIYRYRPATHELEEIAFSMPEPRSHGSAVKLPELNQLFLIGGLNEGNWALNSVEQYTFEDSVSVGTRNISPMNFKRRNACAFIYGNAIYVFGGTNEFNQYVKTVERYRLLTDVANETILPKTPSLTASNYPNPFNPSTNIVVTFPDVGNARISMYDISGAPVGILFEGNVAAGQNNYLFDASTLASGTYFYEVVYSSTTGQNYRYFGKTLLLR